MKATRLKEQDEFQDEINEVCTECGVEKCLAYWDHELESYIYLVDDLDIVDGVDEFICEACELVPVAC